MELDPLVDKIVRVEIIGDGIRSFLTGPVIWIRRGEFIMVDDQNKSALQRYASFRGSFSGINKIVVLNGESAPEKVVYDNSLVPTYYSNNNRGGLNDHQKSEIFEKGRFYDESLPIASSQ